MIFHSTHYQIFFILFIFLIGCSNSSSHSNSNQPVIIESNNSFNSSTAGNLITSALKQVHNIDFAFYPKDLIRQDSFALYKKNLSLIEKNILFELFPQGGTKDQFKIGTLKGKDIKQFILERLNEKYEAELETAGLHYEAQFQGGIITSFNLSEDNGKPIEDNQYYTVAISQYYYFGFGFPSYKYRNGFSHRFNEKNSFISALDSLKVFLEKPPEFLDVSSIRNRVKKIVKNTTSKKLSISEIQSWTHRSPYFGYKVTTKGIITSLGLNLWYPGGLDGYIQSLEPDQDERTSEAIRFTVPETFRLKKGDIIEITGIVYEKNSNNGLSVTSLMDIESVKVLHHDTNQIPQALVLGKKGLNLPQHHFSTWPGNINYKPYLDRSDGLDFYESLEGMRVQINTPKVVGFIGGQEDHPTFLQKSDKPYLTLHLLADSDEDHSQSTTGGGVWLNTLTGDYNPEIITLINNHLAPSLLSSRGEAVSPPVFNIGDRLKINAQTPDSLIGVMGFEQNLFGDGEYALIPENIDWNYVRKTQGTSIIPIEKRPKTNLISSENSFTLGSFNVENLSGSELQRIPLIAQTIVDNLKCPDLLTLVEIQDSNGVDFSGDSSADKTLELLISKINEEKKNKPCLPEYGVLNRNPLQNAEGGQPGGNIQLVHLYNKKKFNFTPKAMEHPFSETMILPDGTLNINPGRMGVNDPRFKDTRRGLIGHLTYKGQSVFLIGNHLNSKLGDSPFVSDSQPVVFRSEKKRNELASGLSEFIQKIKFYSPKSLLLVTGDFNAYPEELSMKILAGKDLINLIGQEDLIPQTDRYTHIHNGNSQAIDFIFSNREVYEANRTQCEIIHLNTLYMGRLSDHDPVICLFKDE